MTARLGVVLFVAAFAVASAAQDPPAFVEVELPNGRPWVGQRLEVIVRLGYDGKFFRERAVPLFQRRLDLPFQVVVPWLQERAERAVQLVGLEAVNGPRLAVGDRDAVAKTVGPREHGGRTFDVLELRCHWVPLQPGEQQVEPVVLRYAFTTRYEESLLSGRQPVDRHDASVASAAQRLVVRELPAGAPDGFTRAVGTFAVRGSCPVAEVELGSSFALELTVTGDGDLQRFAAPPWPALPGFVVQGLVEKRTSVARTFVFDVLAVRPTATAVPPVGFPFFDPVAGVYRTAVTEPVPLRIGPLPAGRELPARVQALLDADAAGLAAARAWPWWYYAAGVTAGFAALLGWLRWRRRAVRRAMLERALQTLAGRLRSGNDEAPAAFAAFCADCIGGGPFDAEHGWQQLAAAGVPAPLAARARVMHETLAAARYGGVRPADDDVLALLREIVPWCNRLGGRRDRAEA